VRGPGRRGAARGRGGVRGVLSQRGAAGPQIVSVHSNRLAGIMNSQYPDDGTIIIDLDDDDEDDPGDLDYDDEEIIVPRLSTSYHHPAPDFDIIADEMSYNTSGEYIEDEYLVISNQQEVYDLE
jgi:hypothetical protein